MSIKIKDKLMSIPIVQGGMGIGISMGELAGAVAAEGGMGTISFVNCGYMESDFFKNPMEANKRSFLREVKKAKEIAHGKGIIMVNIMHVVNNFENYLKFINETEVDGVVVGAGLPLELPEFIDNKKIIAPIISSARALNIIIKKWLKKYNRKPDFVVFEGPEAGGHLGFKIEDLKTDIFKELSEILKVKNQFEKHIPLFIGGGFGTKERFEKALEEGADGVQIGTGFLFTEESSLDRRTKENLLNSHNQNKFGVEVIKSPVGLPARAIGTEFVEYTSKNRFPSKHCVNCISTCDPASTPYCINEALIRAVKGDFKEGLFFCGTDIKNIKKISSVREYIKNILGGKDE